VPTEHTGAVITLSFHKFSRKWARKGIHVSILKRNPTLQHFLMCHFWNMVPRTCTFMCWRSILEVSLLYYFTLLHPHRIWFSFLYVC